METSVLLSVKPRFANKIFEGTKGYEFRRKLFKNPAITRVIVYVSAPVSKVIGEFEVESILRLEKECLWAETKDSSGISKEYFDIYFQGQELGYAIKIGETHLYRVPLELETHFNIKYAPQSFVYIKT